MRPLVLLLPLLAACESEPGACEQRRNVDGVRQGFCVQVDSAARCPEAESGPDVEDLQWNFVEGGDCVDLGYEFDCGEGIFEDIESQCLST